MAPESNESPKPLMPKATAVWLIENTGLTFRQIGSFCGLHDLEIQSIADDEVAVGMVGYDPIVNGQLTKEEIERCESSSVERLTIASTTVPRPATRTKGPRYTPVARRGDKPDAIAWLVKHYPNLKDAQISRLLGTTKPTITAIRDRSHWNMATITARDPVGLGLCKRQDLDKEVQRAGYASTSEAPVVEEKPTRSTPAMPEFKL
tara:strand:- start:101 stop:715 length:615 start_codon:yes stop_codon:yes gene_type:complete